MDDDGEEEKKQQDDNAVASMTSPEVAKEAEASETPSPNAERAEKPLEEKSNENTTTEKSSAAAAVEEEATTADDNEKAARARAILEEEELFTEVLPFPERIFGLLNNESVKEHMFWLPDGDAFCIVPKNFAEEVLNKYFQGTKFESFTRKLNRWYVQWIDPGYLENSGALRCLTLSLFIVFACCLYVGASKELPVKR